MDNSREVLPPSEGACFDILDDLSDDLELSDYLQFILMNDLTYELEYKTARFAEYYYDVHNHFKFVGILSVWCTKEKCDYVDENRICHNGDLKVAKWFHRNRKISFDGIYMFWLACGSTNLDLVEWLYEINGFVIPSSHGYVLPIFHSKVVRWLMNHGYDHGYDQREDPKIDK